MASDRPSAASEAPRWQPTLCYVFKEADSQGVGELHAHLAALRAENAALRAAVGEDGWRPLADPGPEVDALVSRARREASDAVAESRGLQDTIARLERQLGEQEGYARRLEQKLQAQARDEAWLRREQGELDQERVLFSEERARVDARSAGMQQANAARDLQIAEAETEAKKLRAQAAGLQQQLRGQQEFAERAAVEEFAARQQEQVYRDEIAALRTSAQLLTARMAELERALDEARRGSRGPSAVREMSAPRELTRLGPPTSGFSHRGESPFHRDRPRDPWPREINGVPSVFKPAQEPADAALRRPETSPLGPGQQDSAGFVLTFGGERFVLGQ